MDVSSVWFDDLPVIGNLPPAQAAAKLREVGEEDAANALEATLKQTITATTSFTGWWPFQDKLWQHTAHAFGYLAPTPPGNGTLPLRHAGNIASDTTLKNTRIKITLDRLRVASYPGRGTHRVLFDFYAQNQVPGKAEDLHFNAVYRVRQGEYSAMPGYPIFVGLTVGSEGVRLKCHTINVKNDQDEAFLNVLESDVFKSGLHLATSVQPALAPFSELALGLARTIAKRHRNVSVQDFDLGLDFSSIPVRAHLAEGAYVAVQIPESLQAVWDWDEWVYNSTNGQIVNRDDPAELVPYNYLVFSVSRYEGG